MNLKYLELFLHLPNKATVYSAMLEQDVMGTIPSPPLDAEGCRTSAITIMESISKAQSYPLENLTLHLARTGYSDRFQPYLMRGLLHVRSSEYRDCISYRGQQASQANRALDSTALLANICVMKKKTYEFRGKCSWLSDRESREELLFEE